MAAQDGPAPTSTRASSAAAGRSPAWTRLRAFGRRWPTVFVYAHRLALYLLPVELITGAILYFPRLHTSLIAWLPLTLDIHVWAGIAFCALLLVPILFPLGSRLLASIDWVATFWLVGGLAVTGLALWSGVAAAMLLRPGAFGLHGILTIAFLGFVLYHGLVRVETAIRGGDPERTTDRHSRIPRRTMAGTLLRALAGGVFGTAVFGWLGSAFATLGQGGAGAMGALEAAPRGPSGGSGRPIPGFQLYTVTGGYPTYDPTTWRLSVAGLVRQPLSLSQADLMQLPQATETQAFHCVTGWEVPGVVWQGVRIADVLRAAGPQVAAAWITFDSFDGVYSDSLSLEQATAQDVLLAHHANGSPLAREQGAPLRLYVPQMYGYKSVKWVFRLRLVTDRELGYWEHRGYGPDAFLGTVNGWPKGSGLGGFF